MWGEEAAERERISCLMLDAARAWGYTTVETPVLEYVETLAAGSGPLLEGEAFRLFDLDGALLALRPEMTVPLARLVSARLSQEPGPHRLAYCADVFREHASYRGQYRQFRQVGVELVGASGPTADAECVALAVQMLEQTGLREFGVALGDVGVLRALLEAAASDEPWRGSVMDALHARNLVELDRLTRASGVAREAAQALRELPRMRGGFEVLEEARAALEPLGRADALEGLAAVRTLLDSAGVAERVSVDFGIVRGFDYYTGLVLEAHAPGLGLPLGGGGRYDGLLGRFGASLPAAGFAFALERVHIALAEQGRVPEVTGADIVLAGGDAEESWRVAAELRQRGERVFIAGDDRRAAEAKASSLGARVRWLGGGEEP